jgi:hypothetical protein
MYPFLGPLSKLGLLVNYRTVEGYGSMADFGLTKSTQSVKNAKDTRTTLASTILLVVTSIKIRDRDYRFEM